jgi:hypothetical protein
MPYGSEKVLWSPSWRLKSKPRKKPAEPQLVNCFCSFVLGILSNPEDEGSIILRNTGLSLDYTTFQPIRQYNSVGTKVMVLWLASLPLLGRAQILTWEPVS